MATYWSCCQTHPHQEALALRNIRRQGFSTWYPFVLLPNRYRRMIVRPTFPGYVFVQLDDEVFNWSPINNTLGVRRLITVTSAGDYRRPARVPFVDDLRQRLRRPSGSGEPEILEPGTTVRVIRGPFAERVALVEMSDGDRVKLLLQAFNREVIVEFTVDSVQLVRRPTDALATSPSVG